VLTASDDDAGCPRVDQMRSEGRSPRLVWGYREGPSPGYPSVASNGIGLGIVLGVVPLDLLEFAFSFAGALASGAPTQSACCCGLVALSASGGLMEAVVKKRRPIGGDSLAGFHRPGESHEVLRALWGLAGGERPQVPFQCGGRPPTA
jgi:hypothetical protein